MLEILELVEEVEALVDEIEVEEILVEVELDDEVELMLVELVEVEVEVASKAQLVLSPLSTPPGASCRVVMALLMNPTHQSLLNQ